MLDRDSKRREFTSEDWSRFEGDGSTGALRQRGGCCVMFNAILPRYSCKVASPDYILCDGTYKRKKRED